MNVPAWLDAVTGLAGAQVAAVRDSWTRHGRPGDLHDTIDEILARDRSASPSRPLVAASALARTAIAVDGRWQQLVERLGVAPREVELIALVAACELDPRLTQVLGYLADVASPTPPSPAMAAALWGWPLGGQPGPASALARWHLAGPVDGTWNSISPWTMDADIAAFLAGCDDWAAMRQDAAVLDVDGLECLHPELLDRMRAAVQSVASATCEVELVGATGTGRRTLLGQLALALGRRPALITPGAGIRGRRAARLLDTVPVWVGDDQLVGADRTAGELSLVARRTPAAAPPPGVVRLSFAMPATSAAQRRKLWASFSEHAPPRVVESWDLTPADIQLGASASPAFATQVIRDRLRTGTKESMQPLACPYNWDDLVVPDRVGAQLHRLRQQFLLAQEVLDGWEFRRLCPTTAGVTALFAGPSGTGKTMAAQVLARSLDLDLFRVDLAEVVNKYIGETEKRLAAVFDEAERSGVLMLFDEADALFGQRTRVQDAHDRYANIEIDYLLQRLDTFHGVAVLATNRRSDLDSAFLRRLGTIVDFVAPAREERLRLWRIALPASTTAGDRLTCGLDHEWLAAHLELTGAEIKSIALAAAFEARAAGELIRAEHVLDASRRELGKRGAMLRVEPPMAVAT